MGIVPKKNLPNYNEFCEGRYFASPSDTISEVDLFGEKVPFGTKQIFACRDLASFRFGVELCEDLLVATPPPASLRQRAH